MKKVLFLSLGLASLTMLQARANKPCENLNQSYCQNEYNQCMLHANSMCKYNSTTTTSCNFFKNNCNSAHNNCKKNPKKYCLEPSCIGKCYQSCGFCSIELDVQEYNKCSQSKQPCFNNCHNQCI